MSATASSDVAGSQAPTSSKAADHAGLAHVATASFLASRVVPTGGFAVALAGGVALARTAQLAGTRTGYAASVAAMLQAVAVLGPSRISVPMTQALSAPLLGRLYARGAALGTQLAACAAIRAADQLVTALFYIWIIVGGVDAYAATYDALVGRIPGVPDGPSAALLATALGLLAWTAFASAVQVLVYRRALHAWPQAPPRAGAAPQGERVVAPAPAPRYDPRFVALASSVGFIVLVTSTAWAVLGAVGLWLAIAWGTARGDREPVRAGLALAALLGGGALMFGLVGGIDLELTLQRTARAALLVLVATWLRAAAGEEGLREVGRRSLQRIGRLPAMAEASAILDRLGETGSLAASGRALIDTVRHVRRRPSELAAAVLRWIATDADRFAHPPPTARTPLAARAGDWILLAALTAAVAVAIS